MIADVEVTLSTLGDHIANEIQQLSGPNGNQVYALYQCVKTSNAGPPNYGPSQDAFMIRRTSVDSGDMTDTGDVYYTYWFKFPSDLHTQLGDGTNGADNWRVMSEWKTGGLNNTGEGDYRIITHVGQDSQGLYWSTQGDTEANGLPFELYWRERNTTVPVPVGEWFKYEVFWHRSGGDDGRYWAAVNGDVIVDHVGPNMGIYNLPINRIFLANAYSGGNTPIQQWLTDLEIWDGFPCGEGTTCYAHP